ncbi:MAG: glycoside hydrolase family 3 N-terminal domain-containing protein, partial [bacterium]
MRSQFVNLNTPVTSIKKPALYLIATLFLLPSPPVRADETLRQKIAQMIMIGFDGTTLPESVRVDLSVRNLGGVIFLGRNCTSPNQILQLTSVVKSSAQTPPFIAVDQEGGVVARLNKTNGYDSTHSAFTLGSV